MNLSVEDVMPRTALPSCVGGPKPCLFEEEVKKLREQVVTDPLTGLYNVGYFREALAQELERTERSYLPTVLLMIDLDHFKQINDNYGHESGNVVLVKIAKLIKDSTRKLDIQSRYGGEEFAIILPSTERAVAINVAERLRKVIANTPVIIDEQQSLQVTASMGLAIYQAGGLGNANQLIREADKYLYQAKKSGRNQLCYAQVEQQESVAVTSEEKGMLNELFGSDFND